MKVQNSFLVWALLPLWPAVQRMNPMIPPMEPRKWKNKAMWMRVNADADAGDASDDTDTADEEDADSDAEDTGSKCG